MQKDTQVFLGGVDYSGISGAELTRVIIRKGGPRAGDEDPREARRADARAAFLATFGADIDNPSNVEIVGAAKSRGSDSKAS